MKKILLSKLKNLCCGDDGAALVITLGIFFFMYIFCAGVYAIGFAVKERIQLQNACDAAAYSAAVVQADTISRIATINRAMGWTYAQMCKRQMDYIVYSWLDETREHYEDDIGTAWKHAYRNGGDLDSGFRIVDGIYSLDGRIALNGKHTPTYGEIEAALDNMRGKNASSFYAVGQYDIRGLELQIEADKKTIRDMNGSFSELIEKLPSRIDAAAQGVLKANLPAYMRGQCRFDIRRNNNYFTLMQDEDTLVGWGKDTADFGSGKDTWFIRKYGNGIQRTFDFDNEYLRATWRWCSWYCQSVSGIHTRFYHYSACGHGSGDRKCTCSNVSAWPADPAPHLNPYWHHACCSANSSHVLDAQGYTGRKRRRYYFVGEAAQPRSLARSYFGKDGTITVGLMRKATSPWAPILGSVTRGFYSAFNPYCDTYCFASAKAGYKLRHLPIDETDDIGDGLGWEVRLNGRPRAFYGPRDYCIDWKAPVPLRSNWVHGTRDIYNGEGVLVSHEEQDLWIPTEADAARYERAGWKLDREPSGRLKRQLRQTAWRQDWNLIQSDWDAVMLPVRQGGTMAREVNTHTHLEWMESVRDQTRCLYSYEPVWQWNGEESASFVAGLVGDAGWHDLDGQVALAGRFGDMFAGGEHDPDPNGDWGENFIEKTSAGWNGWWDIPKTQADHSAKASRWNIGKQHGQLEWSNISRLMFH